MYVELFGLSGCGKTTLANNLCTKSNSSISLSRPKNFSDLKLINALVTLKFIPRIVFFIRKSKLNNRNKKMLFKTLFISFYLYQISRSNGKINYLGHGFIQTIIQNSQLRQILLKDNYLIREFIDILPMNKSTYIYLKSTIELARKRANIRAFNNGSQRVHNLDHYEQDFVIIGLLNELLNKKMVVDCNKNELELTNEVLTKLT